MVIEVPPYVKKEIGEWPRVGGDIAQGGMSKFRYREVIQPHL